MKEYICAYCGKDTSGVDYDYLVGHNHLSCVLMDQLSDAIEKEKKMNKKKPVEISNWRKLIGNTFDVMGASFIIMDCNTDSLDDGNVYTSWVHPIDEFEPFVRVTLFTDNMDMQVKVVPPLDYNSSMTPYDLTSTITKNHISNPSIFIQTICEALLSDSTTRDLLLYISRKQDMARRKTTGYSPGPGLSGSSGNNLW